MIPAFEMEKTLWEKEKVLVTSIFSNFYNISKIPYSQGCVVAQKVNPFPMKLMFLSLLKTLLEKEKLLITSNFSFFRSVFYPFGELSTFTLN